MNLAKSIAQFNINNVYFTESIKNTVMDNSEFIRIIYSTPLLSLNGICLFIKINNYQIDKYYNKLKCSFDIEQNKDIINKIIDIEKTLLNKYGCNGRLPCRSVSQQLEKGFIKLYSNFHLDIGQRKPIGEFILKLSGIWENENECGITHKFIEINHQ